MKVAVLGDPKTALGLRLAGIKTALTPKTQEECRKALEHLRSDPEVGIIIITEEHADMLEREIESIKLDKTVYPIVVEVPGPSGPKEGRVDPIKLRIKKAVGIDTGGDKDDQ